MLFLLQPKSNTSVREAAVTKQSRVNMFGEGAHFDGLLQDEKGPAQSGQAFQEKVIKIP
jgi:hypothetical protein